MAKSIPSTPLDRSFMEGFKILVSRYINRASHTHGALKIEQILHNRFWEWYYKADTYGIIDVEIPDGFIRVDVRAVGLNFADIFAMQGLYSATPHGAFTPGLEFSGVVSEVRGQRAVEGWVPAVGDKVMGVIRFGGYTTSLVVDRDVCRPLPVAARLLP